MKEGNFDSGRYKNGLFCYFDPQEIYVCVLRISQVSLSLLRYLIEAPHLITRCVTFSRCACMYSRAHFIHIRYVHRNTRREHALAFISTMNTREKERKGEAEEIIKILFTAIVTIFFLNIYFSINNIFFLNISMWSIYLYHLKNLCCFYKKNRTK